MSKLKLTAPLCLAACLGLAAGCGGSSGDGGSGAPPPAQPAACQDKAGAPGPRTLSIESGGLTREFRLFVPESNDPTAATPLVLNFHGLGSNATAQELYAQMVDKATLEGFITAAGQGVSNSWNAGEVCCPPANQQGVDDVRFVRDMVARIESEYCIDARRIYSTGMSNGGFISNRLACEASDLIAAIAPVASVLGLVGCDPARPVPILMFNGTDDVLVPYAAASNAFARWQAFNGCTGDPAVSYAQGDAECVTSDDCAEGATTTLCTIDGGGHTWPGAIPRPGLGHTSTDIDATDAMWEFFVAHPLP